LDQQQQQQQQAAADAGALAAGLMGMAGPDVGFASAAATAAAVAAAAAGADSQNPSSSGSSQNPSSSSSSQNPSSTEPSPLTLQAHAILHCIADLHRLAIRREWTPKGGTAWRQQLYQRAPSPFAPGTSPFLPRQQQLQGLGLGSSSTPSSISSSSSSNVPQQGFVGPPGSVAGSSSSSSTSSSSSSSSSGSGFRQLSSQLLLSCDEGAWGIVGLMLVAWLQWHCGVSQATAVESVSRALGVTLNEVS
jgi:hypothetical protein